MSSDRPAEAPTYALRSARVDEWERAKALRLEMLADTPLAYSRSLAETEAMSDQEWIERQRRGAGDAGSAWIVAVAPDGRWLGQVCGIHHGVWLGPDEERLTCGGIVAVYLTPSLRGTGAAGEMMDAAEAWGRARGYDAMVLMVHEDNARAKRFYERRGYELNGDSMPYPLDRTRRDLGMIKRF